MKLSKKIGWAIVLLIVLLILTLLVLNIVATQKRITKIKTAKESCEKLNEGELCNFTIDNNRIEGRCIPLKKGKKELFCKPLKRELKRKNLNLS